MLAEALKYAELGWRVFPVAGIGGGVCACWARRGCSSPGKHPLTPNGFKDATDDAVCVSAWWGNRWPGANIGGVPPAGVVVVDVDPRNGGEASLHGLELAHGELPETLTCYTGGGGYHFYFVVPDDLGRLVSKLAEGIDVKVGAAGYVVVPPSLHHSGERYRWEVPPWRQRPLPAPEWLVGLLLKPEPARRAPSSGERRARSSASFGRRSGSYVSEYCSTALDGEVEAVRSAPEGERNTTLNRAAFNLGTLIAAGGDIDVDEVIDALAEAAAEAGLDDAEIGATVTSGLESGLDNPRESW